MYSDPFKKINHDYSCENSKNIDWFPAQTLIIKSQQAIWRKPVAYLLFAELLYSLRGISRVLMIQLKIKKQNKQYNLNYLEIFILWFSMLSLFSSGIMLPTLQTLSWDCLFISSAYMICQCLCSPSVVSCQNTKRFQKMFCFSPVCSDKFKWNDEWKKNWWKDR